MIMFGSFLPGLWLVGTTKVYSGIGADIVMESITLIDQRSAKFSVSAIACFQKLRPCSCIGQILRVVFPSRFCAFFEDVVCKSAICSVSGHGVVRSVVLGFRLRQDVSSNHAIFDAIAFAQQPNIIRCPLGWQSVA